ncbi:MAG: lysophospholipid acyltransferase family protein [Myxococcota bacterium]
MLPIDPAVRERVDRLDLPFNQFGIDPYGVDKRELAKFFTALGFFSQRYNRVEAYGVENVPSQGGAMLVCNHSGGVAIDGGMIIATCFFAMEQPRLAQGMVDKFVASLPGAGQIASRVGQFPGLPKHADRLLRDGRLLMVFPEGARGTAKLAKDADSLVRFGTGFVRLALQTGTPIVPMAFLGAGDAFPTVANLRIGRYFGIPYIPIPRYLNPLPRPTTFQLLISKPMQFEGTGGEDDEEIAALVGRVKERVGSLITQGRALRDGNLSEDALELGT